MKIEAQVTKQIAMTLTDEDIQSMLKWFDKAVGGGTFSTNARITELYRVLMELENE